MGCRLLVAWGHLSGVILLTLMFTPLTSSHSLPARTTGDFPLAAFSASCSCSLFLLLCSVSQSAVPCLSPSCSFPLFLFYPPQLRFFTSPIGFHVFFRKDDNDQSTWSLPLLLVQTFYVKGVSCSIPVGWLIWSKTVDRLGAYAFQTHFP